ncbi:MAG: glycosyltransferase [Gemmatimonadales bacterium]|nr:glycosyltransferase [Gemmatimonadales bacterium]
MSSITRLYWSLPTRVQDVMLTLYGIRLRWLRYGALHDETVRQLEQSQWWSEERHREAQLTALNALLFNASQRSNFYRYRGYPPQLSSLEHLEALPVLRRNEVRGESAEMSILRPGSRRVQEISTGGTTGTPLTVYCDRDALQRNYAFFSRLKRWAGLPVGCRTATFAGRTIVPPEAQRDFWRYNAAMRTLLCSSYHLSADHLESYVEALEAFEPELIDSYPSSIEPVARHIIARAGARVRPKAVITSSETLWPEVSAVIRQAFGCPVFDHYGSAEMAAFVSQCEHGTYHVNPEFGIVEILRDDGRPVAPGETGEIVATGFVNPVMPLIRYATGDRATLGPPTPCACGRAFPRLERIEGRMDDVIQTPSGRRIGRLDPIFKSVRTISEARIVQHARDRVRLEYVTAQEPRPAELASLANELHERLGREMAVEVVRVAAIERTGAGKLRTVLNEYARRRTPIPDYAARLDIHAVNLASPDPVAAAGPPPPDHPFASVIVPVRDGMPELVPCLDSVVQAVAHHGNAELIIVDNGSSDASMAAIRRAAAAGARVLSLPSGTISAVRNAGAAASRGDVLVFIDSDCVVGTGHVSLIEEFLAGSEVAATGRRVGLPEHPTWVERCWHDLHDRPIDPRPPWRRTSTPATSRCGARRSGRWVGSTSRW